MADDPWEQYLKPAAPPASSSGGADPWAQYVKPPASAAPTTAAPSSSPAAPGASGLGSTIASIMNFSPLGQTNAAPAGSDLGTTALWNKPANASWGDYMWAHAAKPLQQADDLVRGYTNTFGLGDRFAAGMSDLTGIGGGDLAAQRATSAARAQADPLYGVGQMFGYGPVGEAGMASGIASDIAPAGSGLVRTALGNAAGSAAEGAAANYASALGHGESPEDAASAAVTGGAVGAPLGLFGGALSRMFAGPGPKIPEVGLPQGSGRPATGMYAQKTSEYQPLDTNLFDNQTVTGPLGQAHAQISAVRDPHGQGVDLGIPADVQSTVTKLYQNPVMSGRNLQEASRDLRSSGDWTGQRYADALDNVLNTAQPMSVNGAPTGAVGEAGAAKAAGDLTWGRIQDLERLEETPTAAALKKTQQNYDPGTVEYQAIDDAIKGQSPAFNWYKARHIIAPAVGLGLGGVYGYMNPAEGENPYLKALKEGGEDAILFGTLPLAAKAMARPQATMNAARYAIGTGQKYVAPTGPPISQYLRTLIFGPMAARQGS